ncbi:MAG: hypothetical protein EOO01_25195, partial [Chitinophagaceae bacterium]
MYRIANNQVKLSDDKGTNYSFDHVIISTGHRWPKAHENKVQGWFDSPYPPSKLAGKHNYPVAIKGASLTAIDAIRTLTRSNGQYKKTDKGLHYQLNDDSKEFR